MPNIELPANATLPLAEPGAAWLVRTGSLDVFGIRTKAGAAAGPRRYLFTAPANGLLIGMSELDGQQLIAVASEVSQLERTAVEELALPANGNGAITGVEAWLQKMLGLFDHAATDGPLRRCAPGERVQLEPHQMLRAAHGGSAWAKVVSGAITVPGESAHAWNADCFVPLTDQWGPIAADGEATLEIVGLTALSARELAVALDELHRYALRELAEMEERALREAQRRAALRAQASALATGEVLESWREVIHARGSGWQQRESDLRSALATVAKEQGIELRFPPPLEEPAGLDDMIDAVSRLSKVRVRQATLDGDWWRTDAGPLLAFQGPQRRPVALLRRRRRYLAWDPAGGPPRTIDAATSRELHPLAVSLVRPFPDSIKSLAAVAQFAASAYWPALVLGVVLAAVVSMIGMASAPASRVIIDDCIPSADRRLLAGIGGGLIVLAVGSGLLSLMKAVFGLRGMMGSAAVLQLAVVDRLLRLKAGFFRQYSSGDMLNRATMITRLSREMTGIVLGSCLSGAMSLLNLALCMYYNARLALIAMATALLTAAVMAVMSMAIRKRAIRLETESGKLFGLAVQLVNGITKLRVAGAEQRAFNHWARKYGSQLRLSTGIRRINDGARLFDRVLNCGSMVALFGFAVSLLAGPREPGAAAVLTLGAFWAFYAAFNGLVGGMSGLCTAVVDLSDNWAKRKLVEPLLQAEPEADRQRTAPGKLAGRVALHGVTFRYRVDGPLVLDKINIHAEPSEFVALVGPSGSGKSTLLRLLLGFESPEAGAVLYDRQDLAGLEMSAVRRQIGTVLQNGQISAGSIYTNITGGGAATLDEVMAAVHDAGLADDVEQMPMKLHTLVNEAGRNLSGGQRQRLLIARALFSNPRILLFDEATSALDNRTQRIVSQSLKRRRVTRIVIAHRLSTIQDADRIYVLENGRVAQTGSYSELVAVDGLFRRMAQRQIA